MFVRVMHKRRLRDGAYSIGLALCAVALLTYPTAVATGISRGLSICSSVILPSLFPFMLLSGLLTDSPLCRRPGRVAVWVARRWFGLPGCCAPAILLGLVGGYPAGMMAVAQLYKQGQISREQWRRLSAFCVGGGPGFIVSTVGAGLLGSAQAGLLLFAAQTTVALGIGIGLGRGHRHPEEETRPPLPPRRPFAHVVGDSCGALLTVCGFVTLAAMVLALSEGAGVAAALAGWLGLNTATVSAVLAGILEVSGGCVAVVGLGGLTPLWLSLTLSWAGLSVQGQLAAALPEERLLTGYFWRWRLTHGLLSGGVALLLFHLFPPSDLTAGGRPQALPFSVSASGSVMLLFLCFLTMLYFSQKKTGNPE
ncbi:MAG: hypothetical protein E7527_05845 [Ruminococcaceae bacterium]|nr:hypothetical protein [Oscillospiraceae bacterium]